MKIEIVQNFKILPWKNGLGSTHELLIHPPSAEAAHSNFDYRISSAVIAGACTFSLFEGYERILILLDGAITLTHQNQNGEKRSSILEKLTPHFFSGNDITTAKTDSETELRDLNFIYQPQKYAVKSEILTGKNVLNLQPDQFYFLFSIDTKTKIEQQEIPANKLALMTTENPSPCQILAGSAVLFTIKMYAVPFLRIIP